MFYVQPTIPFLVCSNLSSTKASSSLSHLIYCWKPLYYLYLFPNNVKSCYQPPTLLVCHVPSRWRFGLSRLIAYTHTSFRQPYNDEPMFQHVEVDVQQCMLEILDTAGTVSSAILRLLPQLTLSQKSPGWTSQESLWTLPTRPLNKTARHWTHVSCDSV